MSGTEQPRSPKSPRPQSIMAQNFSLALDDVFGLGSAAKLEEHLEKKEKNVSDQQAELEALEARLRATEQRLQASKLGKKAARDDEDDEDVATIAHKAPVLPGMGLRSSPQHVKKPVATQPDSDDEEGEDTEESSEEEEEDDEDSTEETSSDDEKQHKRK